MRMKITIVKKITTTISFNEVGVELFVSGLGVVGQGFVSFLASSEKQILCKAFGGCMVVSYLSKNYFPCFGLSKTWYHGISDKTETLSMPERHSIKQSTLTKTLVGFLLSIRANISVLTFQQASVHKSKYLGSIGPEYHFISRILKSQPDANLKHMSSFLRAKV